MRTQENIIELLTDHPMGVNEIASATATSAGYIRTQLKAMEAAGTVERVDDRLPFMYKVSDKPKKVVEVDRELIDKVRGILTSPDEPKDNDFLKLLVKIPKERWLNVAEFFEATSAAIRELKKEGKLIETL